MVISFTVSYFLEKTELINQKLTNVEMYANALITKFGLTGWSFKFNYSQLTAGACFYSNKIIKLSAFMCITNTMETIEEILLHEIAHAIVGKEANHGKVWRDKYIAIGGNGKRLFYGYAFAKFISTCSKCGLEYGFVKMPVKEKACSKCDVKLENINKNNWSVR